jgi:hypothetical protein
MAADRIAGGAGILETGISILFIRQGLIILAQILRCVFVQEGSAPGASGRPSRMMGTCPASRFDDCQALADWRWSAKYLLLPFLSGRFLQRVDSIRAFLYLDYNVVSDVMLKFLRI